MVVNAVTVYHVLHQIQTIFALIAMLLGVSLILLQRDGSHKPLPSLCHMGHLSMSVCITGSAQTGAQLEKS